GGTAGDRVRRHAARALHPSTGRAGGGMSAATVPRTQPAAPLIEVRGVTKRFVKHLDAAAKIANWLGAGMREEIVHAVDAVDLAVAEGEVGGLGGESGCGKSPLARRGRGRL